MQKRIPAHVSGLLAYLSRPHERANEDQALAYFREVFGSAFTRQKEACGSDGYVPGSFVLELKGRTDDWYSGLFQGLAYKNKGLDFSQIVVAAREFLAIWRVDDLPDDILDEVAAEHRAPNRVGTEFAKAYASRRKELSRLAIWNGTEFSGGLFQKPDLAAQHVEAFERALKDGQKVRIKITLKNFVSILREMKEFFDQAQPVKAVRAFYSMLYGWTETATIQLSDRVEDKAALGGETITDLVPTKRRQFKDYVENHYIFLNDGEYKDDFFARYDEALDAVDRNFRVRNGIFFTDRDLSKFVMWLVKRHIPNLGKNYLVIDPACGSGNLVTNWRSPLELRHKVVSEIEPELLFAVEKRMKGDQWHNGKFTVVPKTSENRGLNFLDRSAEDYLKELRANLEDKGQRADKPLAFLCNPPYRSDDDQAADKAPYAVHETITEMTGKDASSERYCCFLAQMKMICEAARSSGLPDESRLLLFTKSAWLTKRQIFSAIRSHMLESFENLGGILVDGSEFFDVKGKWPVAFTVWSYNSKNKVLDRDREIPVVDLTWLKKEQLKQIPWNLPHEMEKACDQLLSHRDAKIVALGQDRISLKSWCGETRKDFMRGKRKAEKTQRAVGGLPSGDHRHSNKKAYGEVDGRFIGFMDDLTPCRIKFSEPDKPWLRLNNQFMDLKKNRCFSAPPTHFGYCARDLASAEKLFFWYSLTRTFLDRGYPMWVDSDDLWAPRIPAKLQEPIFRTAFAIGFAENECIEARFPANNPQKGLPELSVNNPMSPLNRKSFWSSVMRPSFDRGKSGDSAAKLVDSVDTVFVAWQKLLRGRSEVSVAHKPYVIGDGSLTVDAGLIQIKDYAQDNEEDGILKAFRKLQDDLKAVKTEFFDMIMTGAGVNYFGYKQERRSSVPAAILPGRSKPPQRPAATLVAKKAVGHASVGPKQPTRTIRQPPVKVIA